ncbi:MAG TPA: hypothetical protein VME41_03885 [Stellaceae bacterium]|nr:hypothetical protein [Stellaceae bacterium]
MISAQQTRRQHLWSVLLIVGSVALSVGFACATPFAAFAALAALTLPRNEALMAAGGVWLANQAVGFAFLHYPLTANCLGWGVALGVGIVIAALTAREVASRLANTGPIAVGIAGFLAAFLAHQMSLLVIAAALLGGVEAFQPAIVERIFAVNAAAFVGLAAAGWFAERAGIIAPAKRRLA